ncbi:MAG TPA: phosphohistidine phosphatase SixA [Chthoniobacterales bacterium]|jgi:phosphohistidine phosphatase
MRLYLLRHGQADWPDWKGKDDDRPLTKAGRQEMHEVGEFLAHCKAKVDSILTSPLPRAEQTADIAAEHLKVVCREEKMLAPGFGLQDLPRLLRKHPHDALMLVGHEPDFSEIIGALTGGKVKMPKAGVALVDYVGKKGKLLWLVPPKLVRR